VAKQISNSRSQKPSSINVRKPYTVSQNKQQHSWFVSGSTYSVVGTWDFSRLTYLKRRVDFSSVKFSIRSSRGLEGDHYDAWRMERDYFTDPGMHGVDWMGMRLKSYRLVDSSDYPGRAFGMLIGEMVGENFLYCTLPYERKTWRDGSTILAWECFEHRLTRNEN